MDKEKLESLLIDFIDGKLNDSDRQTVARLLAEDETVYELYRQLKEVIQVMDQAAAIEPPVTAQATFQAMLREEQQVSQKKRVVTMSSGVWYRVAAAVALLVVGGGVGFLASRHLQQQKEIAELQAEMKRTKELMLSRLGNEESPSQRIMGVKAAYAIGNGKADDDIMNALVATMNDDPNTNVRLAAIDALRKFQNDARVQRALIDALRNQTDPVVQIALIQCMVEMKEKKALKPLQDIIEDQNVLPAVKDEAYAGIFKLS